MSSDQTLPVIKSALAGATVFAAVYVVVFAAALMVGVFGRDVLNGLGALGFCWALTLGAAAGAIAAITFNVLTVIGGIWPTPERRVQAAG